MYCGDVVAAGGWFLTEGHERVFISVSLVVAVDCTIEEMVEEVEEVDEVFDSEGNGWRGDDTEGATAVSPTTITGRSS